MMATGTHQMMPLATKAASAASTTTLSANGSRKAPDRVAPCFRAIHPSTPSDMAMTPPSEKAAQLAPHKRMMATKKGVTIRRSAVIPLAGVSSADGPNVRAIGVGPAPAVGPVGGGEGRHPVDRPIGLIGHGRRPLVHAATLRPGRLPAEADVLIGRDGRPLTVRQAGLHRGPRRRQGDSRGRARRSP